ncbi:hypothetical protein Bca52824_052339 [Brassica carinata]|uniref:Uncharacterized protein n=1 Tax=Brassica carinata TaxID=52824 RepID=A0A8X7R262_BRACI|nr:hypothetical protein Bca52824_052339 [Brassica carinata]
MDLLRPRNIVSSGITISDSCQIGYRDESSSGLGSTKTHHSPWLHKDLASIRFTGTHQSHRFGYQTKESP